MTALVALINNFSIFQGSDTNLEKYCKITRFLALIWPIQAQYCVFWVFLVKFLKNKICHSIRKIFPHILVFSEFCRKSRYFPKFPRWSQISRFSAKFRGPSTIIKTQNRAKPDVRYFLKTFWAKPNVRYFSRFAEMG